MESKNRVLIVLLVISVSLNMFSIIRTNKLEKELEQKMGAQANAIQSRINGLSGQVSSVSSQLGDMVREQEWLLSREFTVDIDKSSASQVYINLDFTVREIKEGAQALVYYRVAESLDWIAVNAEAIGGNSFRAEVVVSGDSDYRYKIQVDNRVDEERTIPSHYYVSRPVIPEISGIATDVSNGDLQLDLMFVSSGTVFNPPTKISLKFYDNNRLVKTELIYQGQGTGAPGGKNSPWFGPHTVQFPEDLFTHLDLEVIYEDGTIHEGEIWPGYEFMEIIKSQGF